MIIPFFIPHAGCPHQCVFCNQKRITGSIRPVDASAIPGKIKEYLKTVGSSKPVHVAFYGGSFTALPLDNQKSYLEAARPFVRSGRVKSIRVSTRPDAINKDILSVLREYGVDTVELGVQSMDDRVLTLSGRGHSTADTETAVQLLREHGFLIGLQLMPGLPGDSSAIFRTTVDRCITLKPAFVRLYPALVIKDTPLEELYKTRRYTPLSLDDAVAICKEALIKFEEAGIEVIRMGLQPTEELERPGTIIAGPYHPAFRQVVESAIMLDRMKALLAGAKQGASAITFLVHPRDLSAAIGQHRSNILSLTKEFGSSTIHVQPDESVSRRSVRYLAVNR